MIFLKCSLPFWLHFGPILEVKTLSKSDSIFDRFVDGAFGENQTRMNIRRICIYILGRYPWQRHGAGAEWVEMRTAHVFRALRRGPKCTREKPKFPT